MYLFLRYSALLAFILFNSLSLTGQCGANFLPATGSYHPEIVTFDYADVTQEIRLAAVSLQGLVNRDTARILLKDNLSVELFRMYLDKGLISVKQEYTDIFQMLRDFKSFFKGAVIYDPAKSFTINLATNIAGTEDRIILSPDMVGNFMEYTGVHDITDLRENNFASIQEAFIWYRQIIFPQQSHSVMAVAHKGYMHDVYRDYLIAFKIPTFWLPGEDDADYDAAYENQIKTMAEETPYNIPVLGFWPDDKGNGYEEYSGVRLFGWYGKFTVVNTWVGNYSFHSAFGENLEFIQTKAREKRFRAYDPSKKYVALIMIESGDSPAYMVYGFRKRQWDDPARGQVPLSYGINPSMRMLTPVLAQHLYETATENDFFFCSISGAGYCYPFEGYAKLTLDSDRALTEYFRLTAENMSLLDLDMMGLYTHPNTTKGQWTEADEQTFIQYMEPMTGLTSLISGMHRNGYAGDQANKHYQHYGKSVTVHHTMTFWPTEGEFAKPSQHANELYDEEAVRFLENEIKTYGAGSPFTQAMFYSWVYGPRRLKKLIDRMESQGYEFVTLNEFDYLYRKSQNLPITD